MNTHQALAAPKPAGDPKLLNAVFNQDQSCFAICHENGFRVYNTDPMELRMKRNFAGSSGRCGIGLIAMLYRTNYVALVGGGRQPRFPVNKLCIWDDLKKKPSIMLEFSSQILNVLLSRIRIVVVLKNLVIVHAFEIRPRVLSTFETCDNEPGVCDLSVNEQNSIIAFPGRVPGQIQLVDISPENLDRNVVSLIKAHRAPIQFLCLSNSGTMVASASQTGTLIRVHDTNSSALLYEFRRGIDKATIISIKFSPNDSRLAVLSDKNTLHVYNVGTTAGSGSGSSAGAINGSSAVGTNGVRLDSSTSRRASFGRAGSIGAATAASERASAGRAGDQNKFHFLNRFPLLPNYFHSTWAFASKDVGRNDDPVPDSGVLGWSDNDSIIVLWKHKGIWEKYVVVDTEEDGGHKELVREGWRSFGEFN